ncbi:MAG: class I SAM-dependent rRNA methyltransferase [Phycisphaerales bacterium]|nr:class I SAM-dependent rRNA methyltransferase [Phycisphaerales bacterium]
MSINEPSSDAVARTAPWVQLRSAAFQTFIYKKMIREASPDARPGSSVTVYDRHGKVFGHGLYNPRSEIAIRMLNFTEQPLDGPYWNDILARAVGLRRKTLRLDDTTGAYRLIHAEGDDLSGLVVDRYADMLSVEVFSLGIWRQMDLLLPILHELAGTRHHRVTVDERVQRHEGFQAQTMESENLPSSVKISENQVRFRVDFAQGHKTGFFCDQRDNRQRLSRLTSGCRVLDLCCYSGGFGLYAKVLGRAEHVTCVDLDENAVEMARRNAHLNETRIDLVHADAFPYMRQMLANGRSYDVLVLDPPKLIFGRNEIEEGRRKYFDLNRLAAALVAPGGVLLTCSCSGAMARDDFVSLTVGAARLAGRQSQILDVTGAAPDHPVSPRCPESAYLKAVWLRLH